MTRRPNRPPLPPQDRYRMRRLSDDEMTHLCQLARQGRDGPQHALDALWDLILQAANTTEHTRPATSPEPFWVQDYSIARDQSDALLAAMITTRRLPRRVVSGFHMMWTMYAPSEYDPPVEWAGQALV